MKANLDRPCAECPFKRKSVPGWLGAASPEYFIETVMLDHEMPCHRTVNYEDPEWFGADKLAEAEQCAGASIFFANICKLSRDPERRRLPADKDEVFASQQEFLDYHTGRTAK